MEHDKKTILKLTTNQVLAAIGSVLGFAGLISLAGGYVFAWEWTGIVTDSDFPKRTLWNWLKLLVVSAVLAGGGYLFTRSENRRTEGIADQGAMDAALQSYLDQMSILLIDKHLHGEYRPHGDTRVTARARTLTVLEELDGGHKRSEVQFLREARLINRMDEDLEGRLVHARVVGLDGADLTDADLKGTKLHNASLKEANLKCADLTETDLRGAELRGANLKDADLRNARYDAETSWPEGFTLETSGAVAS